MGRRKFRLSDMMPNSWFYKLRDMRRAGGRPGASVTRQSSSCLGARGGTQPAGTPRPVPVPMPHRTSYYYASRDRLLQPSPPPPAPPTKAAAVEHQHDVPQTQSPPRSSYRRRHRVGLAGKPAVEPPVDAPHRRRRDDACLARDGGKHPAVKAPSSKNATFTGKVIASDTDIIFDLRDDVPERVLRPIATKPARRGDVGSRREVKERQTPRSSSASEQGGHKGNSRRSSVSSSGRRLKTRANSPRLASSRSRKSKPAHNNPAPPLAESFAVVKASTDPRRDFRESMEEMIAEKRILGAGDLEDLLACYLVLNAAEHHDLIVEVFEEIWRSLPCVNRP